MFVYNQEGRKEHIFINQGRAIMVAQIAFVTTHKDTVANATAALVKVMGVSKSHGTLQADRILLNSESLNIGTTGAKDAATMTVFRVEFGSEQFVGITIEVIDDSNMLKDIISCDVTWISAPVLTSGTNNA